MGGVLNVRGPHPHKANLGPLTYGTTSLGCHSKVLVPMMLRSLLMERCMTMCVVSCSVGGYGGTIMHGKTVSIAEVILHCSLMGGL